MTDAEKLLDRLRIHKSVDRYTGDPKWTIQINHAEWPRDSDTVVVTWIKDGFFFFLDYNGTRKSFSGFDMFEYLADKFPAMARRLAEPLCFTHNAQ